MGRKDKQRDLISKVLAGPEQKRNMKKLDSLTEFSVRSFGGQLPQDVAERGVNEKLVALKDMLQDEREKKQADHMRLAATVRRQQKKQDKKLVVVRDVLEDKIEKKYLRLAAAVRRQQKNQSEFSVRINQRIGDAKKQTPITPGEKVADPRKYPLMTLDEAGKLLGISRSSIYRWIEEGRLQRASTQTKGKGKFHRRKVLILTTSLALHLEPDPN